MLITIINGPNLNALGTRDPAQYGAATLADIEGMCMKKCTDVGYDCDFFQSNSEGAIIDKIQSCRNTSAGLIINPGAYSHTSIAIRDALELLECPIMEVHLSNIHAREAFRHHSHVSAVAKGVIVGLRSQGYVAAIDAIVALAPTS